MSNSIWYSPRYDQILAVYYKRAGTRGLYVVETNNELGLMNPLILKGIGWYLIGRF